jgi:hypothetical protein
MNRSFYLERHSINNKSEIIKIGVFTGYSFYPTMSHDVFEILVKENKFSILDDIKKKYSFEEFQNTINHSFTNNPPVISLNATS